MRKKTPSGKSHMTAQRAANMTKKMGAHQPLMPPVLNPMTPPQPGDESTKLFANPGVQP